MSSNKRTFDEIDSTNEFDDSELTPTTVVNNQRRRCPYLDTVNRQYLDFDNEKICSVTLSNMNIYACLICGKYFQGN